MSHRDTQGHSASSSHAQDLKAVLLWLLNGADFSSITLRGDCRWKPAGLVVAAWLWVWSDENCLTDRFAAAVRIAARLFPGSAPLEVSYQAFMKLMVRWTGPLMLVLTVVLRDRTQSALPSRFRCAGFVIMGGDGSRLGLARTLSNEARFSPARSRRKQSRKKKTSRRRSSGHRRPRSSAARNERAREKKADSPLMWLTTLWHAGTGLPWDWRVGPSDSSERQHVQEMLSSLPKDALLAADANFWGYEFWKLFLDQGRHFVIRVGSNVRLLKKLGVVRESNGTVYVWPDHAARKGKPPLVLRLVVLQGGRHPWHLLTSVLDPKRLSDRQVAEIYRLRWGIELYYRHFKQTFERRKLRSHKAEHAECEAHWAMLGLWAMLLHAQAYLRRQIPAGKLSVAHILRAYRLAMREYKSAPDPGESLWDILRTARIDSYERKNKSSRGYPRKKYEKPPGPPRIRNATAAERSLAKQIETEVARKGLTA